MIKDFFSAKELRRIIKNYKLFFAWMVICVVVLCLVSYFFFFSPKNNPKGTDNLKIWIHIETSENIRAECQYYTMDYIEKVVLISLKLKRISECEDCIEKDRINFSILPFSRYYLTFPMRDQLYEKTWLQFEGLDEKIPLEKKEYFDVSKMTEDETLCYIVIEWDVELFKEGCGRIFYNNLIQMESPSTFNENATMAVQFPNNFEIASYNPFGEENNSFIKNRGKNWISVGSHDPYRISVNAELKPDYSKLGFKDAKIGIFISVIFSCISVLFAIHIYSKQKMERKKEEVRRRCN
ncbi:MAG TPA: hypothetical protein ENI52_01825 [Thermoplasmata archaeon]|nr:hypothetical protein [Thermoplasmata archaeon]